MTFLKNDCSLSKVTISKIALLFYNNLCFSVRQWQRLLTDET